MNAAFFLLQACKFGMLMFSFIIFTMFVWSCVDEWNAVVKLKVNLTLTLTFNLLICLLIWIFGYNLNRVRCYWMIMHLFNYLFKKKKLWDVIMGKTEFDSWVEQSSVRLCTFWSNSGILGSHSTWELEG